MNSKNERILKLWNKGMRDTKQIARKLGLKDDIRVIEGIKWLREVEHRIENEQ